MKEKILQRIKEMKSTFQGELVEYIKELEALKDSVKADKFEKEGLQAVLGAYPMLQTKVISAKTVVVTLSQLELEIERMTE